MSGISSKTLLDFQDRWDILVEKGFADFTQLSREERVWFTIGCLIGDVDNGGIISHYYNSGANFNKETIEDLDYLEFPDISGLLIAINQLFPDGKVSTDIDKRNAIINKWGTGKYDKLLEESDGIFYRKESGLEKRLIDHIENKILRL